MTDTAHTRPSAYRTAPKPPPFTPRVRAMRLDERPFVIKPFIEGYKDSPNGAMPWAEYKAQVVPQLRAVLEREDTRLLVATNDADSAIGWIAFSPWPSIDVVHWVYTARPWRRARSQGLAPIGVMTALLSAALTKRNVVYTHMAKVWRARTRADIWIAERLRAEGRDVSYHPYVKWSRP
jgi:hypothetical protein